MRNANTFFRRAVRSASCVRLRTSLVTVVVGVDRLVRSRLAVLRRGWWSAAASCESVQVTIIINYEFCPFIGYSYITIVMIRPLSIFIIHQLLLRNYLPITIICYLMDKLYSFIIISLHIWVPNIMFMCITFY